MNLILTTSSIDFQILSRVIGGGTIVAAISSALIAAYMFIKLWILFDLNNYYFNL